MTENPRTRTEKRRILSRLNGVATIWSLIALMAAAALALHATPALGRPALASPVHIWWPFLALGFAASEVWVVHVHFRRDAHSFSLSEVPLVLGLFFTPPLGLVLAQLTGAAAALVLHRRQSRQKVFFNLAHFWLGTCLSIVVFRSIVADASAVVGPRQWLGAMLATAVTTTVGILVILLAISISEGRLDLSRFPQAMSQAVIVTATNTSLALAGVTVIWSSPWALWLVLVPAAAIYLSYRGYTRERQRHESLEFLYEASRTLQRGDDVRTAVEALLAQVTSMFRAEQAEMIIFPSPEHDETTAVRFAAASADACTTTLAQQDADEIHALASSGTSPSLLGHRTTASTPRHLARLCTKDGMLAVLPGETRMVGVLVVANRLGEASTFDEADLRLFETLANQASVAIENDRLEAAVTRLGQLQDELSHQAFHDPLTGLANRALLVQALDDRLVRGSASTLLFVDIDDFKTINDSLGHEAGDELLIEVAHRIQTCVGPDDLAARLGGDEFAIVLSEPDQNGNRGEPVAAAILAALLPAVDVAGTEVLIHASIGIALSNDSIDARDLLCDADVAMYHAKSNGKSRAEMFHPEMRAAVKKRHELKADLQRAVDRNEFVVHYQPIVELATGLIVAVEALVRWEHPERGRVAPDEFIPLAEETGHIVDIGRFVLREACRQAVGWHEAFGVGEPLRMNVNLSPRQLHEVTLLADVQAALADSGLEPAFLGLEITESAFVHNSSGAVATLHALRALGVQLAMDDFGTGYSSLGYLRTLPLTALKVPKPFIDGVASSREDYAIAQAIVTLGLTMNLAVIAEGIERAEQLDALNAMGCRLGQGYHFARPLDSLGVGKLLHAQMERMWPSPQRERRFAGDEPVQLSVIKGDLRSRTA